MDKRCFILLFLLLNIDRGYSTEPLEPQSGGSSVHPRSMFRAKQQNYLIFSSENYHFYRRENQLNAYRNADQIRLWVLVRGD